MKIQFLISLDFPVELSPEVVERLKQKIEYAIQATVRVPVSVDQK